MFFDDFSQHPLILALEPLAEADDTDGIFQLLVNWSPADEVWERVVTSRMAAPSTTADHKILLSAALKERQRDPKTAAADHTKKLDSTRTTPPPVDRLVLMDIERGFDEALRLSEQLDHSVWQHCAQRAIQYMRRYNLEKQAASYDHFLYLAKSRDAFIRRQSFETFFKEVASFNLFRIGPAVIEEEIARLQSAIPITFDQELIAFYRVFGCIAGPSLLDSMDIFSPAAQLNSVEKVDGSEADRSNAMNFVAEARARWSSDHWIQDDANIDPDVLMGAQHFLCLGTIQGEEDMAFVLQLPHGGFGLHYWHQDDPLTMPVSTPYQGLGLFELLLLDLRRCTNKRWEGGHSVPISVEAYERLIRWRQRSEI